MERGGSRVYNCCGCGNRHPKPTGKKCKGFSEDDSEVVKKSDLKSFMSDIKSMFAQTNQRLEKVEAVNTPQQQENCGNNKVRSISDAVSGSFDATQNGLKSNELDSSQRSVYANNTGKESVAQAYVVDSSTATETVTAQIAGDFGDSSENSLNTGVENSVVGDSSKEAVNHITALIQDVRKGLRSNDTYLNGPVMASSKDTDNTRLIKALSELKAALVDSGDVGGSVGVLANTSGLGAGAPGTLASVPPLDADVQHRSSLDVTDVLAQVNNNAGGGPQGMNTSKNIATNVNTLQNNSDIIRQAANRLAELESQDAGCTDSLLFKAESRGKKSGAISKATDRIVASIDWPHYHIFRGINLTPSAYEELSVEEFMLGFICMLLDSGSEFDMHVMLEVAKDLLEDSIDFSWGNARAFYKATALDIEKGKLRWEDSNVIQKRRLVQCRVYKPVNNVSKPMGEKKSPKQMPQGFSSCCAAYQQGACDKNMIILHLYTLVLSVGLTRDFCINTERLIVILWLRSSQKTRWGGAFVSSKNK